MRRILFAVLPLILLAAPARAEERYFAYDPANDAARLMTRGITLQAERGLFGGTRVERLFSTAGQGSAGLDRDEVPGGLRSVLPDGADESNAYRIEQEGQGGALSRGGEKALDPCPADQAALGLQGDAPRHQTRGVIGRVIGVEAILRPGGTREDEEGPEGEEETTHGIDLARRSRRIFGHAPSFHKP